MKTISSFPKFAAGASVLLLFVLNSGCASIRPPAGVKPVERKLLITAYCKCAKCCGWERTWYGRPVYASGPSKGKPKKVGVTASGKKAGKGAIAADLTLYPFKTIMDIPGYGYGRVEDCGGGIKGNHIEIFFGSHQDALEWGRQTKSVKVWLP
jgi:3D (Asp-Asp-Asp) domain-containing protein